jgi:hypothetical protein
LHVLGDAGRIGEQGSGQEKKERHKRFVNPQKIVTCPEPAGALRLKGDLLAGDLRASTETVLGMGPMPPDLRRLELGPSGFIVIL